MSRQRGLSGFVGLGLLVAAGCLTPTAARAETVWLSALDLAKAKVTDNRPPASDKTIGGRPLTVNKTKYDKGVCVYGPAVIYVTLGGGSAKFSAILGVDDEAPPAPQAPARGTGGRGGA